MNKLAAILISDIKNAHRLDIDYEDERELTFEEHIQEIESFLKRTEESCPTFSDHCGLESKYFPPADYFTDVELKLIFDALKEMMLTWNHDINLPENLPIQIAYKMTVGTLDKKTNILNSGFICFDFCDGYPPDCVFKEYCSCLELENKAEDSDDFNEKKEGELPF